MQIQCVFGNYKLLLCILISYCFLLLLTAPYCFLKNSSLRLFIAFAMFST